MAYISPFHYLEIDPNRNEIDSRDIQRAKKKILAEFELMGAELKNGLSKDEVMRWIDSLKSEELPFHKRIYENKILLNFLENGQVSTEDWKKQLSPATTEPHFFDHIFALVSEKYDQLFAEAFKNLDSEKLRKLNGFHLLDTEKRGRYYYTSTVKLLKFQYQQLLQAHGQVSESKQPAVNLELFFKQTYLQALNALPTYFQAMRDELAIALTNLAAELGNEKNKQYQLVSEVLFAVNKIIVSPQAQKTISAIRKEQIHREGIVTDYSEATPKNRRGCVVWVIGILILLKIIGLLLSVV